MVVAARHRLTSFLAGLALAAAACCAVLAQSFQTLAPQAVLMDAETGAILFEVNGDAPVAPASLVKIMTAEVVFRAITEGRLRLEDEFTVSENAWRRGGAPAGGSAMFAALNSKVKVQDLIAGLLVASGNDAAIVLAEGVAGSEANFARMMTARARELGLSRSTFRNSYGWPDPEQRTTMREMVRLADHVIRTYPEFYKVFSQREFTWNKVRQQNRNPLLAMDMGADGLKTGNIEESGFSLVASAVQGNQRLILAMSGLKTARDRQNEAKKLMDWGFRNFDVRQLFTSGATVGEASVFGGAQGSVPLVVRRDVRLPIPRGNQDRVSAKITFKGPLVAPVEAGIEVGRLQVFRGTLPVMELPVFTGDAVARGTLSQRAFDAGFELVRGWIRNGFSKGAKKPEQAS